MRGWVCPHCHRQRYYEGYLVMKVCDPCQKEMEVVEDGNVPE